MDGDEEDEEEFKDVESLQKEILEQKVKLAYIDHFPRDMKYISLFPKAQQASELQDNRSLGNPKSKKRKQMEDNPVESGDNEKSKKHGGSMLPSFKEIAAETEKKRVAILSHIQKAIESGDISVNQYNNPKIAASNKSTQFVLRMHDIFGNDESAKMLAKASLSRSHRKLMTKEERLAAERLAGKDKSKPKHSKDGNKNDDGNEEDDDGESFFL